MTDAAAQIGGIAGGLIMNILKGIAIFVFVVILWYLTRFIQKGLKKQKQFTIEAIILDLNGVIDYDMLAFVKSDVHGMLEMQFQKRKADSMPPIPKHLVKGNKVLLLTFAPGHYCVIDTSETIRNLKLGKPIIVPFNLHMKNFIGAKRREILNKQEANKQKWREWLPWITLVAVVVFACVGAWALLYFGGKQHAANIAQRLLECKEAMR